MFKKLHAVKPINPLVMGKIGSAYGIHGYLRVYSFTEKIESIFDYLPWFVKIGSVWQNINLDTWNCYKQDLIVKVNDIEDRTTAKMLTNREIIIDALQLPKLYNNEYYWNDLLGCYVITVTGYQLGKVIDLIETGSNDVLVIRSNPKDKFGIKDRLIPFLETQIIKNIDLAKRVIKVDWGPDF